MVQELNGHVAVVTGAGGGIGRAYARGLAHAGAAVVLADVREDAARAVAEELDGLPVFVRALDVTSEAQWAATVQAATERFGAPDILVNNAALMAEIRTNDLLDITLEEWERVYRVNLTGALLGARASVPGMRERGWGRIVNQSSGGAFMGGGAYHSAKLALHSITVGLARRLAPDGINVNAIAPGWVETDAGRRAAGDRLDAMRAQIPLGTMEPEDLVGTLLYLASHASDKVTGQILSVDGGWVTRL